MSKNSQAYKGVECQSIADNDEPQKELNSIPFSRVVANARLTSTGKSIRLHFFEGNRFFIMPVDEIKRIIERPTETMRVVEYEQNEKQKE